MPATYVEKWQYIVSQLKEALKIPIPRFIGIPELIEVTLHCFVDASDKAIGVCIYLVQGKLSNFYTSKAKVCPIKTAHFTVPRKELTAISLGVRYIKFVFNSLKKYTVPRSVHLWSDSCTALSWTISNTPHR